MDANTLSLILSAAGLGLGFVSAYGQIQVLSAKILRLGGNSVRAWARKSHEEIQRFAHYPSALVAHVAQVFLSLAMLLLTTIILVSIIHSSEGRSLEWVSRASIFCFAITFGLRLGSLSSVLSQVKGEIKAKAASDSSGA